MTTCRECQRVSRRMNADPELYRGEPRLCAAHREIAELRAPRSGRRRVTGVVPTLDPSIRDALQQAQDQADVSDQPVQVRVQVILGDEPGFIVTQWVFPIASIGHWRIDRDADGTETPVRIREAAP